MPELPDITGCVESLAARLTGATLGRVRVTNPRLSPVTLTRALDDAGPQRLHAATREVLREWTGRLRGEAGAGAAHRACRQRDQYCARCQTGGRLLADRALSRLLKASWPKTIDDL